MLDKIKKFIGADQDPHADKVLKIAAGVAAAIVILLIISWL